MKRFLNKFIERPNFRDVLLQAGLIHQKDVSRVVMVSPQEQELVGTPEDSSNSFRAEAVPDAEKQLEAALNDRPFGWFPFNVFPTRNSVLEDGFRVSYCGAHIFYIVQFGCGAFFDLVLWTLSGGTASLFNHWEPLRAATPIRSGLHLIFLICGALLLAEGSPLRIRSQASRVLFHEVQNVLSIWIYYVFNLLNYLVVSDCEPAEKPDCLGLASIRLANIFVVGVIVVPRSIHCSIPIGLSIMFLLPCIIFWWNPDPLVSFRWKIWCTIFSVGFTWIAATLFMMWETVNRQLYAASLRVELGKVRLEAALERVNGVVLALLPKTVLASMLRDELVFHSQPGTVIQADICNFTRWCSSRNSDQVVSMLSRVMTMFDEAALNFSVTRLKVLGDGYIAACGVPDVELDHADKGLRFALSMQKELTQLSIANLSSWGELNVRVGVHSGDVSAGVLSTQRWSYDLYGSVPAIAAELEPLAETGSVLVSDATIMALSTDLHHLLFGSEEAVEYSGPEISDGEVLIKTRQCSWLELNPKLKVEDMMDLDEICEPDASGDQPASRVSPQPENDPRFSENKKSLQQLFSEMKRRDAREQDFGESSLANSQLPTPLNPERRLGRKDASKRRRKRRTTTTTSGPLSPLSPLSPLHLTVTEDPSEVLFRHSHRRGSMMLVTFIFFAVILSSILDIGGTLNGRIITLLALGVVALTDLFLVPDQHKRVTTTILSVVLVFLATGYLDEDDRGVSKYRLDRYSTSIKYLQYPLPFVFSDIQPRWLYYVVLWVVHFLERGLAFVLEGESPASNILSPIAFTYIRFFAMGIFEDYSTSAKALQEATKKIETEKDTLEQVLQLKMPEHVVARIFSSNPGEFWEAMNVAYNLPECHIAFCMFHKQQQHSGETKGEGAAAAGSSTRLDELTSLQAITDIIDELLPSDGTGQLKYLEKIKTIGDVLMFGGCLAPDVAAKTSKESVLHDLLYFREELIRILAERNITWIQCLCGVHCGEVTAATIGRTNLEYDVFGTTVNTAARVMSTLTKSAKISSIGGSLAEDEKLLNPVLLEPVIIRCTESVSKSLESLQQQRILTERQLPGGRNEKSDEQIEFYSPVAPEQFSAKGLGMITVHILHPTTQE